MASMWKVTGREVAARTRSVFRAEGVEIDAASRENNGGAS
jgi:hypothetical protein